MRLRKILNTGRMQRTSIESRKGRYEYFKRTSEFMLNFSNLKYVCLIWMIADASVAL
jgi:hypothetical protein